MAHLSPVTIPALSTSSMHTVPANVYDFDFDLAPANIPQINTSRSSSQKEQAEAEEEEEEEGEAEEGDWTQPPPYYPSFIYHKNNQEEQTKRICLPPRPPSIDLSLGYADGSERITIPTLRRSNLLSLPKEIRLRIYAYALQHPSFRGSRLVTITQKPNAPSYKHKRPPTPKLAFTHTYPYWQDVPEKHNTQNEDQNQTTTWSPTSLLVACHQTYSDALPILYKDTTFHPTIFTGLLPLFLAGLSPLARSNIHTIHLHIPSSSSLPLPFEQLWIDHNPNNNTDPHAPPRPKPKSTTFFNWAVTCAQIARFESSTSTLQRVTISCDWQTLNTEANKQGFLFPLVKIRAEKKYVGSSWGCAGRKGRGEAATDVEGNGHDEEFQELLIKAEQRLTALRRQREKRKREQKERGTEYYERIHQKSGTAPVIPVSTQPTPPHSAMQEWCRWAEENLRRMERTVEESGGTTPYLSTTDDIDAFDEDGEFVVEDWDLISMRSGASTPRARGRGGVTGDREWGSVTSVVSEDDEAVVGGSGSGWGEESDGEGWECV